MDKIDSSQKTYSIYAGDFQFRTPQDQGPVQNAAFDKGIVSVALRSLYSDSTSPSYIVKLMKTAYSRIDDPSQFTGLVGMGDYLDLGCTQEMDMLMISLHHMLAENPQLRFVLMAPGNHDGGQFMGTIWSTKNFGNLTGVLYPDFITDVMTGACGEPEYIQERHETVKDIDRIVRNEFAEKNPIDENIVHLKHGNRRKFKEYTNEKFRFSKKQDEIFNKLWKATPELNRWDSVIHYDRNLFDEHHEQSEDDESTTFFDDPFKKLKEFAHTRGDVKQWIHLQAHKQTEFTTESGSTIPVYQIALDTMDFTSSSDFSGAIKGHLSQLQISIVENFMDQMLKKNPNAKFKLVMHYPLEEMVKCAQKAMKRLLRREEVDFHC